MNGSKKDKGITVNTVRRGSEENFLSPMFPVCDYLSHSGSLGWIRINVSCDCRELSVQVLITVLTIKSLDSCDDRYQKIIKKLFFDSEFVIYLP